MTGATQLEPPLYWSGTLGLLKRENDLWWVATGGWESLRHHLATGPESSPEPVDAIRLVPADQLGGEAQLRDELSAWRKCYEDQAGELSTLQAENKRLRHDRNVAALRLEAALDQGRNQTAPPTLRQVPPRLGANQAGTGDTVTLAQTFPFGQFLDEELKARKIPRRMLRRALGLSLGEIHDLIDGRRELTEDIAARLGAFLGTSAELWLNLDRIHQTTHPAGDTVRPGGDVIERSARALANIEGAKWEDLSGPDRDEYRHDARVLHRTQSAGDTMASSARLHPRKTPWCCHVKCDANAEWGIYFGQDFDDYTHACTLHVGELLDDHDAELTVVRLLSSAPRQKPGQDSGDTEGEYPDVSGGGVPYPSQPDRGKDMSEGHDTEEEK